MRRLFAAICILIIGLFALNGYLESNLFSKLTELWLGLALLGSTAWWAIISAHQEAKERSWPKP